jgi:hypothetical protein
MSTNCSGGNYTNIERCDHMSDILGCSVADLQDFDADPDPSFQIEVKDLYKVLK